VGPVPYLQHEPSGPETEERLFTYRLHSPDGDDLGEGPYAMMTRPGEEIHGKGGELLKAHRRDGAQKPRRARAAGY
jgi:hypothetical protein